MSGDTMIELQRNDSIKKEDVNKVAELHARCMKDTVLGVFGTSFLSELYDGITKSGYGAIFIYKDGDKIVGFVSGTTDTGKMLRSLVLRKFTKILSYVIRHPKLLINLFQSVMFHSIGVKAELLPILVIESYRKKGIGKMLMDELIKYFKSKDVKEFKVLSDVQNEEGNNFYMNMGFTLVKTVKLLGKKVNCYIAKVE